MNAKAIAGDVKGALQLRTTKNLSKKEIAYYLNVHYLSQILKYETDITTAMLLEQVSQNKSNI